MSLEQYYKRKWELVREIRQAARVFPRVCNSRRRRLVQLIMENEACSAEQAKEWIDINTSEI